MSGSDRTALVERLSATTGDAALAAALVDRWEDPVVEQLLAGGDLATAIVAPTLTGGVDAVLAFAFGNRVAADGTVAPGPVNADLAAAGLTLATDLGVPFVAQWEIADSVPTGGDVPVVSIGADVADDGSVVYLSTAGVATKAVRVARDADRPLRRVAIVAFADHAVRCVLTARSVGLDAGVVSGVALPDAYDAESGQPWTRTRLDYLSVDLPARLPLL